MRRNFTKGLLIGSLIGASVSMMMDNGMMSRRSRRRMMSTGRNIFRKSGSIIADVVDMIR